MSFEYEAPDEMPKSNFLETPGTFHFTIAKVDEAPVNKEQMAIDGFSVSLEVLEGTVRDGSKCTEIGKELDLVFFNGKATDKDGGKFARQKQAAFFIAAELMSEADLGKRLKIDLSHAKGRQIVATLESDERNPKYLRIAGTRVYRVDDPKAAAYPKCQKSLALIGKAPKAGAQAPATTPAGKSGNGAATSAAPATTAAAPATAAISAPVPAVAAPAGNAWNL